MKYSDFILALRLQLLIALAVSTLWAQGETTSAIVGSVSEPAGAAIAGAKVTITSTDNGLKRSVKTDHAGRFNFPQLKPGPYSMKVEAEQFEAQNNDSVLAGLGQKQTVEFTLNIATANQNVTVTDDAPLINPQNPNTSTTLTSRVIESLPNPGGDMTYPIQFAAGIDEYCGERERFRRGHQRLWQRPVQWLVLTVEWLHCRRLGDQRSAHQSE